MGESKMIYHPLLHRWLSSLFGLGLALLVAGCTVTVAPPTEPEAGTIPVRTYRWQIFGFSEAGVALTLDHGIDHIAAGRLLDREFYHPDFQRGLLVDQITAFGLAREALTLEYALVNNGSTNQPQPAWTLYYLQPPTGIVTATYVMADAAIEASPRYTVTAMLPLTPAQASAVCAPGLLNGIACLRLAVGFNPASTSLLNRQAAYLLFSTQSGQAKRYLLVWFWIDERGTPEPMPGGSATLCEFCSSICRHGWCTWGCQWVRCE